MSYSNWKLFVKTQSPPHRSLELFHDPTYQEHSLSLTVSAGPALHMWATLVNFRRTRATWECPPCYIEFAERPEESRKETEVASYVTDMLASFGSCCSILPRVPCPPFFKQNALKQSCQQTLNESTGVSGVRYKQNWLTMVTFVGGIRKSAGKLVRKFM